MEGGSGAGRRVVSGLLCGACLIGQGMRRILQIHSAYQYPRPRMLRACVQAASGETKRGMGGGRKRGGARVAEAIELVSE